MWTYRQSDGELLHDGEFIGTGYSGAGDGSNNPAQEAVQNAGPIPRGLYTIAPARFSERLGPIVMNLDPNPGTEVFGRDAFRIHGDNLTHDASHGCIILGPSIRRLIADSSDKQLTVIQ